jgi:hypothetical protein
MTPSTDLLRATPAFAAMPTAAAAMADVSLAAAQRIFVLHVELVDGLVGLAVARSRRAATDPAGTLRDTLMGPAAVEPAWRYATGLMAVAQGAAASMVSLAAAQARGASGELDGLSRDARDAAARSAVAAASAANAAMTHGLSAFGQLAGSATQAALQQATDGAMRAAADVAVRASDAAMGGAGATVGVVDAAGRALRDVPRRAAGAALEAVDAAGRDAKPAVSHRRGANGHPDGSAPRARAAAKVSPAARKNPSAGRGAPGAGSGTKASRGTKRGAPRG